MKNISLQTKIIGLVVFLLILLFISSSIGIIKMKAIGNELQDVAEEDVPLTKTVTDITEYQLEQAIWLERILRFGNIKTSEHDTSNAIEHAEKEFDKLSQEADQILREAELLAKEAIKKVDSQEARLEFAAILEKLGKIDKEHLDYEKHADHLFKLINEGNHDAANKMAEKIEQKKEQLNNELKEFNLHIEKFTANALLNAEHHEKSAIVYMITIGIISMILGLGMGLYIARNISIPIKNIIHNLSDSADQVSAAANQVSSSSQSLAEGASEQAASIEETSASMEEISSMTKQNNQNSNQADNLMKTSLEAIKLADVSIDKVNSSIQEISIASDETSKIIKTIDEIAFQTNLLALNAAVEAARAGESGAGFAVVAEEVRNLAMRSAEAAKNTASLIDEIVQKVHNGKGIVTVTSETFKQVNESSSSVGSIINEITTASNEQSQGIEQITIAISQMEIVTQQNASTAEESASASEELNAQAETMADMLLDLQQLVDGGKREPSTETNNQSFSTGSKLLT